jgi:hypothetical protein
MRRFFMNMPEQYVFAMAQLISNGKFAKEIVIQISLFDNVICVLRHNVLTIISFKRLLCII